jgi:hypothetical protein
VEDGSWEDNIKNDLSVILHSTKFETYLNTSYILPNGEPMIKVVIGTITGHIQIWYDNASANQTRELIDVLNPELARQMTSKCIK